MCTTFYYLGDSITETILLANMSNDFKIILVFLVNSGT